MSGVAVGVSGVRVRVSAVCVGVSFVQVTVVLHLVVLGRKHVRVWSTSQEAEGVKVSMSFFRCSRATVFMTSVGTSL